jgi:hypothetical protein
MKNILVGFIALLWFTHGQNKDSSNNHRPMVSNVKAPFKKGIWFENSGHLIPLEEPGKMLVSPVECLRPIALK